MLSAAPPAEAPAQENGEDNVEVKEPVDPAAPKKCDVIVLSGRKERCEAAVEALKVSPQNTHLTVETVKQISSLTVQPQFEKGVCGWEPGLFIGQQEYFYYFINNHVVVLRLWFLSPLRWKCLLSFTATSSGRKEVESVR